MWQESQFHGALTVFAALNLLDMASTSLAFQVGLTEGNQLPSMLLASGGEPSMYLFKAATALLVIAAVWRLSPYYRSLWRGLRVANWLLGGIVLLNALQVIAG